MAVQYGRPLPKTETKPSPEPKNKHLRRIQKFTTQVIGGLLSLNLDEPVSLFPCEYPTVFGNDDPQAWVKITH